jgi:hypothetical protein
MHVTVNESVAKRDARHRAEPTASANAIEPLPSLVHGAEIRCNCNSFAVVGEAENYGGGCQTSGGRR